MLISVNRANTLFVAILVLVFFAKLAVASAVTSEGVKETQKALIEQTRDINREGIQAIEAAEDAADKDDDDTDQNAVSVEKNQVVSPEENVSPLLSRDYLNRFDIPIVFNDAVDYFIRYFTVQKRKVFVNWLKRARRYAPTIRKILREQGLPEDLVYLAMIESGFNPKAYSPMKACGPWQFIYETGERYGLRVNYWVDERRDPQKSTVAAARYLKDLFNQFGCWYLAAAGYNAGEGRIERAIAKHETNDFWELRKYNTLPRETREYIPQLIAAAVIAKDPEKFGLTNIPFDAPIPSSFYRIPGGTPLSLVAKAGRFDLVALHSLNPEILRGITPPDAESYPLRLPDTVDRGEFNARLKDALQDGSRVLGVTAHVAKRKDSVSKITKQYGISHSDLMLVNACEGDFNIRPGSLLYIPRFERDGARKVVGWRARSEEVEKSPAAVQPTIAEKAGKNKSYHIVRRGERLPDIARRYGVDIVSLRQINGLKSDRIRPNTRIVLVSGTRINDSSRKDERTEAPAPNRIVHLVKNGENLAGISEKYGTDVATLRKINKLKRDRIVPNMRLEVVGNAKTREVVEKTVQARSDGPRGVQPRTLQPRPAKLYHVVKKGENLTDISAKYSLNVISLKKMNGLKTDGLRPGMRLKVARVGSG
jgi:membrane-bound lytic murein transglycosylase D